MSAAWAMIHFLGAAAITLVVNWLNLLPFKRAKDAHWTERARALWPARSGALGNIFLVPVVLHLAHEVFSAETNQHWLLNGIVSALGALSAGYPFDRAVHPALSVPGWLRLLAAGWCLRLGIWILFVLAIVLMPSEPNATMAWITGGYLVVHFGLQCGLGLALLRWFGVLRPAPERLENLVRDAARQTRATVRAVWVFDGPQALAYAMPTTRELLFGERLIALCDDEELQSVAVHELGHLTESRQALAGRLAGSLVLFPLIFIHPAIALLGLPGIALLWLCTYLMARFSVWLSEGLEKRADTLAAELQQSEGVYAAALEKLYSENLLPAVNPKGRQTHPSLYDRMTAAGSTPGYPRPAPPLKISPASITLYVLLGVLIGLLAALK